MIKVDKISSLDGKQLEIKKLVTFENGVLRNDNNDLTFDTKSGLKLERINCDTQMIVKFPDIVKDQEYNLNQEIDENPFIRVIPSILMQPSDEIIDPSHIRLVIKYDTDFVELVPKTIDQDPTGAKIIYDSIDINTNNIQFKILTEVDGIANIKLETFSY